jgi:hypothetical protein
MAAAIVTLRSEPNARYLYSALPLWFVPFGALLGWMAANQRWLYRLTIVFLVACAALNAWFLPASGYYHKDFCLRLPFSRAERDRYLPQAAPVRDVIAYYNRAHPGSAVLFTHDSSIAGTSGEIYENHWHQSTTSERILRAFTVPEMLQLMRSWKVEYFIAHKPAPGEAIWPKQLAKLIEVCSVPEYERGDTYLARLDPSCDAGKLTPPIRQPTVVASPGFYDDFDPVIVYRGNWSQDETFAEAAKHTVSYTDIPGSEVIFAFDAKALNWVFTKAPNRGVAEVTIDGVSKGAIDLYSPVIEWQSKVRFCCFTAGKHVLTIRVTGQTHAKSTGRFVDVDGFLVEAGRD